MNSGTIRGYRHSGSGAVTVIFVKSTDFKYRVLKPNPTKERKREALRRELTTLMIAIVGHDLFKLRLKDQGNFGNPSRAASLTA